MSTDQGETLQISLENFYNDILMEVNEYFMISPVYTPTWHLFPTVRDAKHLRVHVGAGNHRQLQQQHTYI